RPFSWRLAGTVLGERRWRLATGGYLGHMWELYSFWTWITAFVVASAAARARAGGAVPSAAVLGLLAFAAIAVGGLGCVGGGCAGDRPGLGHRLDSTPPGGQGRGGRRAALRQYEDPNVAAVVIGCSRRAGRYDPRATVDTHVEPMHAARHRQRDLPRVGAGAAH